MHNLAITFRIDNNTNRTYAETLKSLFSGTVDLDGGTVNLLLKDLKPMNLLKIGFQLGERYTIGELDIKFV